MRLEHTFDDHADRWTIVATGARSPGQFEQALTTTLGQISNAGGGLTHLWIHEVDDESHDVAVRDGFVAHRDLWQLRCALPAEPSGLETRSYTSGDADALVGVNNRAFSWHPEQSGMTRESLAATMTEPWFDPDGLRLLERDGVLIGFCWTKIHRDEDPELGEIFVIAVDPSAHGQGLGSPMTRAGLDWLAGKGIRHGMLYVESDNVPANRTYERIGFVHHHTNRAYNRTIEPSPR